jgi:diguanylate cyclase (GGDEF)-like protein
MRASESDRALDAVGTLLKTYGRFAFDTERAATLLREQCEHWAQRIVLGEISRDDAPAGEEGASLVRDWHGVQAFFSEQRRSEGEYVARSLGGLRKTVLALARCLSSSVGEDRSADARVESSLEGLARALAGGDTAAITRNAAVVIEAARDSMAKRRSREVHHVQKLGEQLRELQSELAQDLKNSVADPATGLPGRAAYEQQLEQLAGIGMLLEQRPWLAIIEVHPAGKPAHPGPVDEAALGEVSKVLARSFLRRQDFVARPAEKQFAVLVVDMTEAQMAAAAERLLDGVRKLAEGRRRGSAPSLAIGLAALRADEEPAQWRTRADRALARAKQDGGDGYAACRL